MKLGQLIECCNDAIPQSKTWRGMSGEFYGLCANGASMDRDVRKVLYSVTHSNDVELYAINHGYDLIVSHHPGRAESIPHLVYHTALDCCQGGLNDMWADAIGMPHHVPFDEHLGAMGAIKPTPFRDLVVKCLDFADDIVGEIYSDNTVESVRNVIVCTGLGGLVALEVRSFKPDCFITGQLTQHPSTLGIPCVIEIGHTLSERCGVRVFERILRPHGVIVDCVPEDLDVFGSEVYSYLSRHTPFPTNRSVGVSPWRS